jgi:uncharacterized protein (UPF0548 family)
VFLWPVPDDGRVRHVLASLASAPFTQPAVGLTREDLETAPEGFVLDAYGTEVGKGEPVFRRACQLIADFGNYPPSFTRVIALGDRLEPGRVFGTLARHLGFASLHPCRVVYTIDEPGRMGYGLGTLPGHVEAGEERFLVSLDDETGVVRYDVLAYSRPVGLLARLGAPVIRGFQKRFQRETLETMRRRCGDPSA